MKIVAKLILKCINWILATFYTEEELLKTEHIIKHREQERNLKI